METLIKAGEKLGTVEIAGGEAQAAELLAAEDFSFALAEDEVMTLDLPGPGFVYAPVTAGADAGFAHVRLNGKAVGRVKLQYGETVEQFRQEESFWDKLFGG